MAAVAERSAEFPTQRARGAPREAPRGRGAVPRAVREEQPRSSVENRRSREAVSPAVACRGALPCLGNVVSRATANEGGPGPMKNLPQLSRAEIRAGGTPVPGGVRTARRDGMREIRVLTPNGTAGPRDTRSITAEGSSPEAEPVGSGSPPRKADIGSHSPRTQACSKKAIDAHGMAEEGFALRRCHAIPGPARESGSPRQRDHLSAASSAVKRATARTYCRTLYLKMHHMASKASFRPIFLPWA